MVGGQFLVGSCPYKNAFRGEAAGQCVPWRDQLSMQCPLCEAAFRASTPHMLRRILGDHLGAGHGKTQAEALEALDPLPDPQPARPA